MKTNVVKDGYALTCVVDLLQAALGTVCLAVTPDNPQAAAALDTVLAARAAVRRAAQILTGQDWTYRDAGTALSLSHQRIGQILADA